MKEQIKAKIDEIICSILQKPAAEITYDEYKVLDAKMKDLKFEDDQKEHQQQMAELMAKTFTFPIKETSIAEKED